MPYKPISDGLRRAIRESGLSLYRIAKDTGIDYKALHRFATKDRGLSVASLDSLAKYLHLELRGKQ